jgi:beta-N-acetylhexosaminidase
VPDVDSARTRRRRAAVAAGCGLAIGAFALGVTLGNGDQASPSPVTTTAPTAPASRLDTSQLAGVRIVTGFQGDSLPASVRRMIGRGEVAGVILYSYNGNLPSRDAGRRLIRSIEAVPRPPGLRDPLLVMIDQEGGLVKRIGGAPSVSAQVMGERGAAFSRDQGRRTARNLRDIGVNVDLAPVLDVARPGSDIADTDRGFGSTPAAVAATAVPFAEGLQAGGVAATAKNFPGMGSATVNTDEAEQRIGLSKATLRRVDEAPYARYVDAGGEMVMLSTAIYPALSGKPAAFSHRVATRELRGRMGFDGVSITDALETGAVSEFGTPEVAGLAAVRAGADLLLYPSPVGAHAAHAALARALSRGALPRPSFEESAARVLRLRDRLEG